MPLQAGRRHRHLHGARSKSTGKFAGATGHGTYAITILAAANLLSDNTVCDWLPGYELAKGTSVTFKASGPLTLRQ